MRGSIALDKNITLEDGERFFDLVTELYRQRRVRATGCAVDEKLKDGKQLEKEAGSVTLEKAIEQEYRRLREFARARREQSRQSQAFASPDTETYPELS
jgi:hypothetical protein